MYFILSKLLLFLLLPICWIAALLLIALFTKRPKLKRLTLIYGVVLLIFFSNPYILFQFARLYDIAPVPLNKNKVYSAAIVLGGFSGEDKNGNGFFNDKSDRFIQCLKLKFTGQVSHILVSGGSGNPQQNHFTEAGWVKGELLQFNIPDTAILIEQKSRNTLENAAYTKELLKKAHLAPPYLLVTSSWHMRRSWYIFKKAGLDVIPYPCDHISGNYKLYFVDYLPFDAATLSTWNLYTKEVVGLVFTYIKYVF